MLEVLSFYLLLLLIAVISEPLMARLGFPFSAFLVFLGFAGSELFIYAGGDTGLRWDIFHDLVFFLFLPVLIFEAAFNMNRHELGRNLPQILLLAVPLTLLATVVTATLLYFGVGHPQGFPWMAALIAAALLSATDPVAVLALFKRLGAPERLRTIVDGESLFNDATAIVLFVLLLSLASGERSEAGVLDTIGSFVLIFSGGTLAGALVAGLAMAMLRLAGEAVLRGVISLLAAYGAFLLAESMHLSGVMATLVAGLILGRMRDGTREGQALHLLWEYKGWIANTLLFLISGISFQLAMFSQQWLAMLIGIAAVLVARATNVFLLLPLLERLPGMQPTPRAWRPVIWSGGVRGAVTLALALSLPVSLDYWWTIQSIAYGVVLWTLLVHAGSMPWLMRRLGLAESPH